MSTTSTNSNTNSNTNSSNFEYDDELDETFESKLVADATESELNKTLNSFEIPRGIEDMDDSNVTNGPQIDKKEIDKLWKHMASLPREKQMEMLQNILSQEKFGLGDNNFSRASADRVGDTKTRLRAKIAQKQISRKPKTIREIEYEKTLAMATVMESKNTLMNTILDGVSEQSDVPKKSRAAIKNAKRRIAAKEKAKTAE